MTVTKRQILTQIQRIAQQDGGRPPGTMRFAKLTGIRNSEWLGRYWARWGDAIKEAGLEPNTLNAPIDESILLEKYIAAVRELGNLPVATELRMRARSDPDFPSHSVWWDRFGSKANLVARVRDYCEGLEGYGDIIALCDEFESKQEMRATSEPAHASGYVYLMQSGTRYKIGKTNALGQRQRQLQTGSPQPLPILHYIKTDDPAGIERYWHDRFAEKRVHNEWFELSKADVADFRRRKTM